MTEPPLISYQLLIRLAAPVRVQIGRLGAFDFPAGRYVYTGSARRTLEARIARHLRPEKNRHWHIDHLLAAAGAAVTGTLRFAEPECEINSVSGGVSLIPGFGAGDCRAGCGSHLKYLDRLPEARLPADFRPAGPESAAAISELALDIWQRCYLPGILSAAELAHFWRRGYEPAIICADMAAGAVYERIELGGAMIGFLSYQPEFGGRRLRLGKLYVAPEFHGRGIGAAALARVQAVAERLGFREVGLYVFRRNERAIRAYQRAGFIVERAERFDAGEGFFYDDYIMVWTVPDRSRVPPAPEH